MTHPGPIRGSLAWPSPHPPRRPRGDYRRLVDAIGTEPPTGGACYRPDAPDMVETATRAAVHLAMATCRRCAVLDACDDWARRQAAAGQRLIGIVAGRNYGAGWADGPPPRRRA